MLPLFSLGPLSLRLPELFILFGFWIGLEQARNTLPSSASTPTICSTWSWSP